ncbi:Hypothetical predicted protein [Mytilus galloprovincialis]|uniref:Reverse transcriptase domain-containing protein n=1 Tax=Mytilus galloprovincialis TaxID=29158 RepID=A0A8B6EPK3_MYTGA|nr:Hypothetical predicted protein [Mytilus galloprovincialis]
MLKILRRKNPKKFYQKFKRPKTENGHKITLEQFQKHFKNLMSNNTETDKATNTETLPNVHKELDIPFTDTELEKCLRKLKYDKSTGFDNIMNEYLIAGDVNDPNNYRGISLVSHVGKFFTSLLNTRLLQWSENVLTDAQFGFRPGFGTVDAVFALYSLITNSLSKEVLSQHDGPQSDTDSVVQSNTSPSTSPSLPSQPPIMFTTTEGQSVNLSEVLKHAIASSDFVDCIGPFIGNVVKASVDSDLSNYVSNLEAKIEKQEQKISDLMVKNLELKESNKQMNGRVDLIGIDLEELQQYGRRNSLRFHNVPLRKTGSEDS